MQAFLLLLKYHELIVSVIKTIESMIPDGDPNAPTGPHRLDMALTHIIAADASLAAKKDQLAAAIGIAKATTTSKPWPQKRRPLPDFSTSPLLFTS